MRAFREPNLNPNPNPNPHPHPHPNPNPNPNATQDALFAARRQAELDEYLGQVSK